MENVNCYDCAFFARSEKEVTYASKCYYWNGFMFSDDPICECFKPRHGENAPKLSDYLPEPDCSDSDCGDLHDELPELKPGMTFLIY